MKVTTIRIDDDTLRSCKDGLFKKSKANVALKKFNTVF